MSLYAIADTHLSFGTDKPMDSFEGWQDYTSRLEKIGISLLRKTMMLSSPATSAGPWIFRSSKQTLIFWKALTEIKSF